MKYRVRLYDHVQEQFLDELCECDHPPTIDDVNLWIEKEFEDPLDLTAIFISPIPYHQEKRKVLVLERTLRCGLVSTMRIAFMFPEEIAVEFPGWTLQKEKVNGQE